MWLAGTAWDEIAKNASLALTLPSDLEKAGPHSAEPSTADMDEAAGSSPDGPLGHGGQCAPCRRLARLSSEEQADDGPPPPVGDTWAQQGACKST
jgi:hypothetical protein